MLQGIEHRIGKQRAEHGRVGNRSSRMMNDRQRGGRQCHHNDPGEQQRHNSHHANRNTLHSDSTFVHFVQSGCFAIPSEGGASGIWLEESLNSGRR
jgi:hypothetical protein